jgi:excisionase family DNA binding protein
MAGKVKYYEMEGHPLPTQLLTIREVAALLKINPQVAQRRVKAGQILAFRLGGTQWRIYPAIFEEWLAQQAGLPTATAPRKIGRPRTNFKRKLAKEYPDVFGDGVVH